MAGITTRRKTLHWKFGQPTELIHTELPLELDVYNYYKFLRNQESSRSQVTNDELASDIAAEVSALWTDKGNLRVISLQKVLDYTRNVIKKGNDLLKISLDRRQKLLESENIDCSEKKVKGRKAAKHDFLENLFDISTCKHKIYEECVCPRDSKVAQRDFDFLQDQRTQRKMCISNVDKKVTTAWEKYRLRKEKHILCVEQEEQRVDTVREEIVATKAAFMKDSIDSTCFDLNETEFTASIANVSSQQNRITLSKFASELDRYHISDRAGAALATALLEDLQIVKKTMNLLLTSIR